MSDSIKFNAETCKIEFDPEMFVDQLPKEGLELLRKYLVHDEYLMKAVVDALVTGEHFQGWWFDTRTVNKWREQLVELMPEAARMLINHLVQRRDDAVENGRRHDRWAWQLCHYHRDRHTMRSEPDLEDYEPVPFDRARAEELFQEWLKRQEGDK